MAAGEGVQEFKGARGGGRCCEGVMGGGGVGCGESGSWGEEWVGKGSGEHKVRREGLRGWATVVDGRWGVSWPVWEAPVAGGLRLVLSQCAILVIDDALGMPAFPFSSIP